jgi:hypothetical protein
MQSFAAPSVPAPVVKGDLGSGADAKRRIFFGLTASVPVIADKDLELFEVSGLPVAKVRLFDGHSGGDSPAEFAFIREADVQIQKAFLEFVLDPIHHLATQSAVGVSVGGAKLLSHGLFQFSGFCAFEGGPTGNCDARSCTNKGKSITSVAAIAAPHSCSLVRGAPGASNTCASR